MNRHEPLYNRLWRCPTEGCEGEIWFSYWEVVDVGTPICRECDREMALVSTDEAPARLFCVGGAEYEFYESGGVWGIREKAG